MKKPSFQVGDKVTPIPEYVNAWATVPALVAGRVYCVERVNFLHNNHWLRLVGVREHKIKCCDDRGVSECVFRPVGQNGTGAKKGGAL